MTPEAWGTNLGAMAIAGVAAVEAFRSRREARGARREAAGARTAATGAETEATLAADRSEPTSNGFAQHTREALARIEAQTTRTSELLSTHIADHARGEILRRNG